MENELLAQLKYAKSTLESLLDDRPGESASEEERADYGFAVAEAEKYVRDSEGELRGYIIERSRSYEQTYHKAFNAYVELMDGSKFRTEQDWKQALHQYQADREYLDDEKEQFEAELDSFSGALPFTSPILSRLPAQDEAVDWESINTYDDEGRRLVSPPRTSSFGGASALWVRS